MIDFHAHVLPCCDHGSDSIETSCKQMRLAVEAGVDTVIATPHFYPNHDNYHEFLKRRARTAALLREHSDAPKLLVGCEVNLCPGLDHMEELELACIEGTRILLVEMPVNYWSNALEETLLRLHDGKLTVVLAHVDRYDERRVERLLDNGMLAQINAESVCAFLGRRRLFRWIDQGNVVALGSDIHGVKPGYAEFTKAVSILKSRADTVFSRTEKLLKENRI